MKIKSDILLPMTQYTVIANFLLNLSVKNVQNRLRFDKVTAKVWGLGFLEHGVVSIEI